jgi:spermidine synthase
VALWFDEAASPHHQLRWKVRRCLYSARSPYQEIQVIDTEQFGPSLVLDGIMQTTAGDEFIYHEMLAHVALVTHPAPERVLIVGGGDGGTAREVLRCPTVRAATMVEIDPEVVEAARRFLPAHTAALDDPRLEVRFEDGAAFLGRQEAEFDVILVDATDPEGDGPGKVLYTPEFHAALRRALRPRGLYIQHTGAPFYNPEVVREVSADVASRFPLARLFSATIPTYPGGYFTFIVGSLGPDPLQPENPWTPDGTRWYTPAVHRAAFALPPYIAALLPASMVVG